jgi:hypothetical protein
MTQHRTPGYHSRTAKRAGALARRNPVHPRPLPSLWPLVGLAAAVCVVSGILYFL